MEKGLEPALCGDLACPRRLGSPAPCTKNSTARAGRWRIGSRSSSSLFADRTSDGVAAQQSMRLYFSSVAYLLMQALRRLGLAGTELARAQCAHAAPEAAEDRRADSGDGAKSVGLAGRRLPVRRTVRAGLDATARPPLAVLKKPGDFPPGRREISTGGSVRVALAKPLLRRGPHLYRCPKGPVATRHSPKPRSASTIRPQNQFSKNLVRNRVSQNRFFWGRVDEVRDEASDKGQLVGAAVSVGGQGDQQNRDVSDGAEVTS